MALSLQQRLDEARTQYHLLVTGRQARVFVDSNGERLEFTAANRQGLLTYIQQLEAELAGEGPSGPSSYRPLGFFF
jgi:hypothetical protein